MHENFIIYGNCFVLALELFLIVRQLLKLYKAKYTPFIQKIHENKKDFIKMVYYNSTKLYHKIFESIFDMMKLYLIIRFSVLQRLYENIPIKHEILRQVALMLIFMVINNLLHQPFAWISTFLIEQWYGFNKTTVPLYIVDYIKTEVLTSLIMAPVLYIVIKLIQRYTDFYLPVFAVLSSIQLVLIVVFPIFIQPLFNKFNDLEEGTLREKIIQLAKKVGFKPSKILKMDGSKRSHHSNAYFVGLFKEKRIVLYDTLIEQTNEDEILAILCHEFGHWYHNHIPRQLLPSFMTSFLVIYGLNYYVKSSNEPIVISMVYFSWFFSFASPLFGLTFNYLTRVLEREADIYAVRMGYADHLKSGLVKIHAENMSNLCPDKWFSTYHHSHPTLTERIELIDSEMKKME